MPREETHQAVAGALLASGFPFQTAIAELIRRLPGWKVDAEELPWQDEGGKDRFIDLVATRDNLTIVVECKKTQKDTLTFLHPRRDGDLPQTERIRCVYTRQIQDSTRRIEVFAGEWAIAPHSPESMFCVVSTSATGQDQRMLERDAQILVRSTDALASTRPEQFRPTEDPEPDRVLIPIIATNAPLFSTLYHPKTVSLDSGSFESLPAVQPMTCVRFRKSFFSDRHPDLGDRTVFVVNTEHLAALLVELGGTIEAPKHERGPALPRRSRR